MSFDYFAREIDRAFDSLGYDRAFWSCLYDVAFCERSGLVSPDLARALCLYIRARSLVVRGANNGR